MGSPSVANNSLASRWKNTFRALKHRNFQLFFSGQLISLIGTWMQTIAESWLVYRMTGSSVLLGSIGFAAQIPVFLFAPLGGVAADRISRHRLVIATQISAMILALTYATLILTNRITIHEIFILAALLGVVNAFDIPARQAFMVEMVGREDLMNAIALNSSLFNGARIVGPAVAGMLIAKIGEGWCFFGNGISYIAVITGLLMMRIAKVDRRPTGSQTGHIIEGFRFVRNNMPIRDILLLLGVISLVAMPYAVLMPIFADRILHGGARGLGILMGATGIGALLAALTLAARSGLRGLGKFVGIAAVGFGLSLIAFSE
ncbi:MAG TPA: MFS transporter, partial [Terriglobales bacterium]|nr:MFS transporter [Terriglobales bacterium]